jgi:hypothetical protein
MEELPDQWKEFIIVPIHKKAIKLTVEIIGGDHCYQSINQSINQSIDQSINQSSNQSIYSC